MQKYNEILIWPKYLLLGCGSFLYKYMKGNYILDEKWDQIINKYWNFDLVYN